MVDYELDDERFEAEYGMSKDEARASQKWINDYWDFYGEDLNDNDDDD